jgi:Bacterial regulatory helix-turn-helix protein, lysR family
LSGCALPDLRQLRTFVAVAQERNFTRAAQQLHLAQQAVSKSVAQLERELGVELLERTTREVRLTPAGRALRADGVALLRDADAAFARAREVGRGLSGTLRVGVSPALGPPVRDAIVAALRDGAPDLPSPCWRSARATSAACCASASWTSSSPAPPARRPTSTARRCGPAPSRSTSPTTIRWPRGRPCG